VLISSLHSRDVTRVYGKPLAGWASPYPLTEEEQQAIQKARNEKPATSNEQRATRPCLVGARCTCIEFSNNLSEKLDY
jgi:hypothetical protein